MKKQVEKELIVDGDAQETLIAEIRDGLSEVYPLIEQLVMALEETGTLTFTVTVGPEDKENPQRIKMFLKRKIAISAPVWVVPGEVVQDGEQQRIKFS